MSRSLTENIRPSGGAPWPWRWQASSVPSEVGDHHGQLDLRVLQQLLHPLPFRDYHQPAPARLEAPRRLRLPSQERPERPVPRGIISPASAAGHVVLSSSLTA